MLSTALPPVLSLVTSFAAPAMDEAPGEDCVVFLADNYTRAWAEAKDRNVPVLVLSWDGWEGDAGSSVDAFYTDRSFLKAANHAVIIICSQKNHGETTQRVRGETRTVCGQFGCFPPGTAARMLNPVFQDFGEGGILKTPLAIIATPDKEIIDRFVEETPPSTVIDALAQARRRLGKGLGNEEAHQLMTALRVTRRASELKDWRAAGKALSAAAEIPGDSIIHTKLDALREAVAAAARQLHAEAREQWSAGDHLRALQGLDEVAFNFEGTAIAKRAARELAGLLKSPDGKPLAKAVAYESRARELYHQGADLEAMGEYKKALSPLKKLVRSYSESLWAEKGESLISLCEDALERN